MASFIQAELGTLLDNHRLDSRLTGRFRPKSALQLSRKLCKTTSASHSS